MPQQNTHKRQKDEAMRKTKQRKERLYQQKQQQKQPQPRATQPPAQAPQQPARQPTVVLPDYTDRAKKLGELIALYLKGSWNWNDGMQMARQYAPNGTTEAELRAAVMHAAKVQGNTGVLEVRALVQPEVVHPQVNISDLPKQSRLQNVARGLQAPLRVVTAGATQLAAKKNPTGQYGKESGGKPFPAPQSFAESYASDPTFGSALELAFPNTPQWFRVLLGGALDFVLDPTNLLVAAKPVKTVVSTVGKKVGGASAVKKVTQPVKNVAGAVGTQVMHPTAASMVKKQVAGGVLKKAEALSDLGKAMDEIPVYSYSRNVGGDMLAFRNELDDIIRRANQQGINIPQTHNILDFEKYVDTTKQARVRGTTVFSLNNQLQNDLNHLGHIETQIRAVNSELADELQKLMTRINRQSGAWYEQAKLVDSGLIANRNALQNNTLYTALWEGARAVFRREILPRNTLINKAIDVWKRTKTTWNPATHTRNFLQNFVYRYLTGDVDAIDLALLPRAVRDVIRFRKLMDDVIAQGGQTTARSMFPQYGNLDELADLAYILSYRANIPSFANPTQWALHQPLAGLPFTGWQSAIFPFPNRNAIRRALQTVLSVHTPTLDDTIRTGMLAQERGIPISQLPRSWWDVIPSIFRRVPAIWREAKADKRTGLGAVMQRTYQGGDTIPALLMEAVRRRKALMSGKDPLLLGGSSKFRMDYSSIPEAIGLVNIAALPFFSYQYLAMKGLQQALRRNPERIYNIVMKPIERSTRVTQADDEQGVSQSPRFGFAQREMFPVSETRGIPYSSILPIDPQFAEPFLSLSGWVSRSPLTAIARPFVENRDDSVRLAEQVLREITPASLTHFLYAIMGEPQRGMKPSLQHTRGERLLRAIGINIQPVDAMRIAQQQQRQAERKRNEPLYDDPATITGFVQRIMRYFGW